MSLTPLSPDAVQARLRAGAVLIDIRSPDEHAREHIAEARTVPLAQLNRASPLSAPGGIIFHCRSGNRTQMQAPTLRACVTGEACVLEGGLDAWKRAGLPVVADARQPLELQRQVQIAAGVLILLGAILGATVSPWWHLLSAGVGAGLVFAGVSGFCGMARLLLRMPWNRAMLGR